MLLLTLAGYSQFQYWYPVNKAVTIYRAGAMTLPWSEGAHVRAARSCALSAVMRTCAP